AVPGVQAATLPTSAPSSSARHPPQNGETSPGSSAPQTGHSHGKTSAVNASTPAAHHPRLEGARAADAATGPAPRVVNPPEDTGSGSVSGAPKVPCPPHLAGRTRGATFPASGPQPPCPPAPP